MAADIRADQPGGAGSGVAGQARTGLWVGVPIELHDVGAGTPGTRNWSLVDRPEGSAAVVGAATSNPATFTGDVPGRYLVMLSRDGNVNDPSTNCMVRVFEVSLSGSGAAIGDYYPLPAAGEKDHHSEGIPGQGTSGRGWTALLETFRDALQNRLNVVTKNSGATLDSGALNLLNDNGAPSPAFVLPAPATWTGRRISAKRLNQLAASASITVDGGALIDGASAYSLVGRSVSSDFWSNGTAVYVGPTSGQAAATMRSLPSCSFHLAPWNASRMNLVSGLVDSATDQAGGGNVMAASTSAARMTYHTSGVDTLNGHPSVGTALFYAAFEQFRSLSGGTAGAAAYSLACVAKYRSFDPANLSTLMTNGDWPGSVVAFAGWIGASASGTDQDGGGYLRGLTTAQDGDLLPHTFISTHDGTTGRFYIDGFLVAEAASTPDTRTGKIGIYTTAAGSRCADAARFDAQWCSSNIGTGGVKQYVQDAAEFFGLWKPGVIYCNGDSITACNTLLDAATNGWPVRILALINSAAVQVVNAGVGGRTIETIANVIGVATSTNAQFSHQRRFGPGKIGNIEIIWAGTNDNYGITGTGDPAPIAADIWTDIQTRANASIARGFVPIVGTMLRRASGTAQEETVRTTVNTSIRNGPYRYFDLAEHPGFLSTASVAQTVVGFSDGIHPTDQANIDVIAPAIAAAINEALLEEAA